MHPRDSKDAIKPKVLCESHNRDVTSGSAAFTQRYAKQPRILSAGYIHPKSENEKAGASQSLQTAFGLGKPEEKIGDDNVLSIDHEP
jgi:hypothetical protein